MDINLQVRYYSSRFSWLCFRHAIELASKGLEIKTDIDNFSTENYLGPTYCEMCDHEERRSEM